MAAVSSPTSVAELPGTIRLYISPLNPSLLPHIVPASVQLSAVNVSYHSIETFPEKTFGYLDLPTADGQKLRNKLNGSFLKGMKVRVELARPEKKKKRKAAEVQEEEEKLKTVMDDVQEEARPQKRRKEKPKDGVLPAVELPEHRQVKRGWVQPPAHEKKRSKGGEDQNKVEKSQMIFRTNIPPNVASNASRSDVKKQKSGKETSGKEAKRGKPGKMAEVKEFSKTTKYPTFLRDSKASNGDKQATSFVDGKGWVDDEGNLVEPVKSRSTRRMVAEAADKPLESGSQQHDPGQETDVLPGAQQHEMPSAMDIADATTSSSPSSNPRQGPSSHRSRSSASEPSPDIPDLTIDPPPKSASTPTPPPKEIHPLEALFKRPRPPSSEGNSSRSTPRPAPIMTSFSFFGNDGNEEDVDDNVLSLVPPQTPFTRRDLETRGIRSAAPTPDTAAIGRRASAPWETGDDDDEDDDDDDDDDGDDGDDGDGRGVQRPGELANGDHEEPVTSNQNATPVAGPGGGEDVSGQTEFEKHFWAHRGEYNRGWKARKRVARKEVRQSENRRTGAGGVGR